MPTTKHFEFLQYEGRRVKWRIEIDRKRKPHPETLSFAGLQPWSSASCGIKFELLVFLSSVAFPDAKDHDSELSKGN